MVEDEPLLALDNVAALEGAGATVLGPAGTVREALGIIGSAPLDAAVLDANLQGHPVDEIAAALTARNVPFLFVTGYGPESLPQGFLQDSDAVQAVRSKAIYCGRGVAPGNAHQRTPPQKLADFRTPSLRPLHPVVADAPFAAT